MGEIDEKQKLILEILNKNGKIEREKFFGEIKKAQKTAKKFFEIKRKDNHYICPELSRELFTLAWAEIIRFDTTWEKGYIEQYYSVTKYGKEFLKSLPEVSKHD